MIDDGMGEGWTSMDGRRRLALGLALTQPREGPQAAIYLDLERSMFSIRLGIRYITDRQRSTHT